MGNSAYALSDQKTGIGIKAKEKQHTTLKQKVTRYAGLITAEEREKSPLDQILYHFLGVLSCGQNCWQNSFARICRTEGPSPLWAVNCKVPLPSCDIGLPILLFISPKSSGEKVSRVSLLAMKVSYNLTVTEVTLHRLHYIPLIINKSQILFTLKGRG